MEHAGATFLRESAIIFPQEPTKSDHISRAVLIFHEAAHQWFGDTVTMKWFDDLWLKEGFANFMAYKALERIMPEANAWKVFYERIKQPAYATDSTRGTTPIYQPIDNLNSAKSAYGNIVYNKAPAFLKQAEFYLGADKFQTAVRAFLKKHEFKNAKWEDLVTEFESATSQKLEDWAKQWIRILGMNRSTVDFSAIDPRSIPTERYRPGLKQGVFIGTYVDMNRQDQSGYWGMKTRTYVRFADGSAKLFPSVFPQGDASGETTYFENASEIAFVIPNYQDYGYGLFMIDTRTRTFLLKNVHNEKDAFLRSMMYGAMWDSVREGELDPRAYVEVAIKNLPTENDETIAATVLSRTITAFNYYLPETAVVQNIRQLEDLLIKQTEYSSTRGRQLTYFRAFINVAASMRGRAVLKQILANKFWSKSTELGGGIVIGTDSSIPLKTKDRFDIVTRLAVLNDTEAAKLLAELEKTETTDDAKRYAYAARAAFPTKENREKYWNDFVSNKDISESWIEAAFGPFNAVRNSELSLPYLERALKELPNLKRSRKIFFVNNWLGAFIGGQRSEEALAIVNKFLADNPNLDRDLRLKILENVDIIERAVRIRGKFKSN